MRDSNSLYIVRATKELLKRMDGPSAAPDEQATNALGVWYATALFWKLQVALFVNESTLLPVFLPLAPAKTVVGRFPAALRAVCDDYGFGRWFDDFEGPEMTEYRLDSTRSRSVLGSMNDFVNQCDVYRRGPQRDDLLGLSLLLAETPCGPLRKRTGFPDRELVAVTATELQANEQRDGSRS